MYWLRKQFWFAIIAASISAMAQGQTAAPDPKESAVEPSQTTGPVKPQKLPAQNDWGLLSPGTDPQNEFGPIFIKHLAQDQAKFWTSPFHMRSEGLKTAVPFFAFTGALIASDSWISKQVPDSPSQIKRSRDFSNLALISLVGTVGSGYVWGHITNNDHLRETGILSAEAALNSTAVTFTFKEIFQRPTPTEAGNSSAFFRGGSSFPSQHSAIAWSVASVLAHEYPGTLTKLLAYGLASGVTVSRVTGKEHFGSDAFVGSALGWYLGRQIYRAHHDPEVGGTGWGSSAPQPSNFERWPAGPHASPYVPLDSWIYPALERLAAWGYLQTSMLGQRPWTRAECARLIEEADGQIPRDESHSNEVADTYRALERELLPEQTGTNGGGNLSFRVDSIYTRATVISGQPLTDGYNFGRTLTNDYGRPFQEGTNNYSGVSMSGTAGPLAFYFRGEYQHSPSASGEPLSVRQAIADAESVPVAPFTPFNEMNRARLIEGYVSLALKNLQFSFGKQSLWWGPTETGPLLTSTNAESITMLRISTGEPFKLPSLLGWLGPVRTEFFIGQLEGQQYILDKNGVVGPDVFKPQPFIHGQKFSFKPTPNLEFGFSRTVVFSGLGHPFTFNSFARSFFGISSNSAVDVLTDPGDRRSGFDFNYRLPYLRKWLSLYSDSFCEDDVSPLAAPHRCAWSPGLYLAKFPGLEKLDLRAEGVYTDSPGLNSPGTNYQNVIYRSGYTNYGNIIGSWVGRQGTGVQLWSTYWLSPQTKIQAGYRHQSVDRDFLQGGKLEDFSLRSDLMLRPDLAFSGAAQYESWNFPLLAAGTKSNVSISISLTFHPKWGVKY